MHDPGTAHALFAIVQGPVVEEICKGLGLYLLAFCRRKEFDGVIDGVVYATMIALGFAMVENINYYGYALRFNHFGETFWIRGVLSPFSHPLFTCMTGIGLGMTLETGRNKWRAPAGLLLAILLHSVWNFFATIHKDLWNAAYGLLMTPCALIVLTALDGQRDILRNYLAREIPAADLESISSITGRYRSSLRYLGQLDFRRLRLQERFLRTASQLAFLRWRQHQRELPPRAEEEEALRTRLYALRSEMASHFARPSA